MNTPILFMAVVPLFLGLGRAQDRPSLTADDQQQLPGVMHSRMKESPRLTVGVSDGDLRGADNRALQAAVDYIARLGGGVVEVGAGEFAMRDSLHLRPHVTVRGQGVKTVLRKSSAHSSPLVLDGDYGEEQVTLKNPEGFAV